VTSDHYDFLEVPRAASREEIEAAYRKLVAELDAEKNPALLQASASLRLRADEAYAVLSDPARRAQYDGVGAPELASGGDEAPSSAPDPLFWVRMVWGGSLVLYAFWEFATGSEMTFGDPYEKIVRRMGLMPFHILENALRGIPGRREYGPLAYLDAGYQLLCALVAFVAPYQLILDGVRGRRRRFASNPDEQR